MPEAIFKKFLFTFLFCADQKNMAYVVFSLSQIKKKISFEFNQFFYFNRWLNSRSFFLFQAIKSQLNRREFIPLKYVVHRDKQNKCQLDQKNNFGVAKVCSRTSQTLNEMISIICL